MLSFLYVACIIVYIIKKGQDIMIGQKPKLHLRSKLALLQFCLVLPLIALTLFVLIKSIQDSTAKQIEVSRNYSLQNAAVSFDQIFNRVLKLLEKPYTDQSIYKIITTEYGQDDVMQKQIDKELLPRILRNSILYYEPNILSVNLVSELADSSYYSRSHPASVMNIHNSDWYNLTGSSWYQAAKAVEGPVISPANENELFLNSGITLAISQRLKKPWQDCLIGVIRIDLSIWSLYENWQTLSGEDGVIFTVLDQTGQVVYCSSDDLLETTPLLSKPITAEWETNYNITARTAPISGFQFIYLAHRNESIFQPQLLFGLPLLILLVGILYAVVFISWSSRHISRPIRLLKAAMLEGQQEYLTARCPQLNGEMGVLSDAFNSLMERIGLLINEVARNEQEKARLSYEVLQSKVSPHFLYNTLSAIRWKADMLGVKDISRSLDSLSSLLRFSIKCTTDIIPFETELKQLENYVQIMRIRYGDNLSLIHI